MKQPTDRRIANRIRKGGTDRGIGRQLGVSYNAVARVRRELGASPFGVGRPTNWPDLPTMIQALSDPVDGGHMRWTGHIKDGQPTGLWKNRRYSIYRLVFTHRRDRTPQGYVRPGCDYPQCVAPDHLEDRLMRLAAKNQRNPAPRNPAPQRRHSRPRLTTEKTMTDTDWIRLAACKNEDPELFQPVGNTGPALEQAEEAKAVCPRCPVMAACRQWAFEGGPEHGVLGGMSEDERRSAKRRSARQRAAAREAA